MDDGQATGPKHSSVLLLRIDYLLVNHKYRKLQWIDVTILILLNGKTHVLASAL